MKIEIDVDAGSLGETLAETLRSLSKEKREEICVKIIEGWLRESHDLERQSFESNLPTHLNHWDRNERIRGFKSSRETMIAEITKAAVETYQQRTKELVEQDQQLKDKYEEVKKVLIDKFPDMVQHTMVNWFVSGFSQIGDQMTKMFGFSEHIKELLGETREKLGLPPYNKQGY